MNLTSGYGYTYNRYGSGGILSRGTLGLNAGVKVGFTIFDGNRRRAERSRWLLLLLIPFVFVFLAEAMYLFLWLDNIENWFK